jgi:multicomponent K+:H+ antiporter subunit E
MTRVVPHPLLTAALIVMWLLLNRFSLGHLLLGTAIALVAGRAMAALEPARPRLRRPDLMLRLFGLVMLDVRFVEIDLELRDPTALAALAVIVTSTPGTAWVDYDAARGRLLLHVLDLVEPEAWRDTINNRYGRLLKEIFE